MSTPTTGDTCEIVIGLLVPRPCGAKAKGCCTRCKRPMCLEHSAPLTGAATCTHCGRNQDAPAPLIDVPDDLAFRPEDLNAFNMEDDRGPASAWSDLT